MIWLIVYALSQVDFYGDSLKPYISAFAVVMKYQKRISGPVLDCIGIHIEVPHVDYERIK